MPLTRTLRLAGAATAGWQGACAAFQNRSAATLAAGSAALAQDDSNPPPKEHRSAPHVGYGSGGRVENVSVRLAPEAVPFAVRALSHVSVVVPDAQRAAEQLRMTLGAQVSEMVELPERGIGVVSVHIGSACLMLMQPLWHAADTPTNHTLMEFLSTRPHGGIHHLSFTVDKLCAAAQHLEAEGVPLLRHAQTGDTIHTGVRNNPVLRIDPGGISGLECELEQVSFGRFSARH